MNEPELKYGCNPNQKPSRIFMRAARSLYKESTGLMAVFSPSAGKTA